MKYYETRQAYRWTLQTSSSNQLPQNNTRVYPHSEGGKNPINLLHARLFSKGLNFFLFLTTTKKPVFVTKLSCFF